MQYRAEATSVEGFVQQIACCYLRHGYWFYVTGCVPPNKSPHDIDRKLIDKYGIAVSESTRARRKQLGQANLQYLRHDRFFVLLATKGRHDFFDAEYKSIHDIRRIPLKYGGYSISYRRGGRTSTGQRDSKWHAHVEIERRRYLELKACFLELATHRSAEKIALAFYRLPFEPYAPVRRQMLNILRAVNQTRRTAGFRPVPTEVLPLRRRIVRPFGFGPERRDAEGPTVRDGETGVENEPDETVCPCSPTGATFWLSRASKESAPQCFEKPAVDSCETHEARARQPLVPSP